MVKLAKEPNGYVSYQDIVDKIDEIVEWINKHENKEFSEKMYELKQDECKP